jgi:hypothetical protein
LPNRTAFQVRIQRLSFLAPDIVAAVIWGEQPTGLTTTKVMADTGLPFNWPYSGLC